MNPIYQRCENTVLRKIADEFFLVPIRGTVDEMERLFHLNPVAEFIWQSIDGKTSLDTIRHAVTEVFSVSQDLADMDIGELIDEFLAHGLIQARAAERTPKQ